MSSQNDSSFVRYFKARLVPLARPRFWAPIGLVGLAGFVLWQFKEHPERWATTVEQPVGTQNRAISDPTFPIRDPIPEQGLAINPLNTELQPFVQPAEQMPTLDANSLVGKKSNSASEEGIFGQSLKQPESQSSSDNALPSDPLAAFLQPNYKSAFKGNNPTSKAPEPVKPIGQVTPGGELQKFRPVPSGENPLSKAVEQVFSNNSPSRESQPSLPQVQSLPRTQVNQPNNNPSAVQAPAATQPQYNQPYSNPYAPQTPPVTQPQYNQPYSNPYAVQTPPVTQPQYNQPYSNPYAPQTPPATQPQYNQPYSNPDFDRTPSMQPTLRVR